MVPLSITAPDPTPGIDPILERIRAEMPECVPHYGERWRQYLLSWEPVLADPSGGLRRRLAGLRRDIRAALGLDDARRPPSWDRNIRLEHFWFLYEKDYIDPSGTGFRAEKLARDMEEDFGGIDAVCLWQSYPRLGLDHRNQYDYYRDLPGGLAEVSRIVKVFHGAGIRAFLNYNPWDTGTRREPASDAETLASLLERTGADGVFLDTVEAADRGMIATLRAARSDVAVCPELLPPLPDLGTVSGSWQQFAHPSPPLVLAHRWLDPAFCLRLVDRYARSRREQAAAAFLHGTGHVVWENVFGWWNPWSSDDRRLLGKTTAILRAFAQFFRDPLWEPYVPTGRPGVAAMEWHDGTEALFTIYNANPFACHDISITIPETCCGTIQDVWDARELEPVEEGRAFRLSLGPGEVGCVLVGAPRAPIRFAPDAGDDRRHRPVTLSAYALKRAPAARRPRSRRTVFARRDMVLIRGGRYVMRVRRAVADVMEGGSYGDISHPTSKAVPDLHVRLGDYLIDRTPVTKAAFADFLRSSGYRPLSLSLFLADWTRPPGTEDAPREWLPPEGRENHPVVWVSLDDARAYAAWAGVVLPTEAQWQRAAEGPEGRVWPWGSDADPSRCNDGTGSTTPVDAFPAGASAEGCLDMSGNVWEWTDSERDDGHMRYVMVRGGSFLKVTGSDWYTASGAQPCGVHEKVPLLAAGIDRLSTVGFRCAL